jgi:hypothetical protein
MPAKRRFLVALVFAITFTFGVTAQEPAKYVLYGPGVNSCGKWVQDKQGQSPSRVTAYDIAGTWVTGFISGYGYVGPTLRPTDFAGIVVFMDSYCESHPLDTIAAGAQALVHELSKTK